MTTEIAASQPSTELTVAQRASIALKAEKRRSDFIELAGRSKDIVGITNHASYQECHAARMRLKDARVDLTKEGKSVREDAVKFQKGVIALEAELIGLIEPEENRLFEIQDAHDRRIDEEKQAVARAELERLAAEERARKEAEEKRLAEERAELARQRAELERAQLEREEADRIARRKIEEEERAARARIEERERQARALREQADREAQALRDAEADRLKDIQDRLDAEKLALRQEREAADERERQERLAQERRDRELREIAETAARKEREKAEAEQRERDDEARRVREAEEARQREEQRKVNELLDGREMLATFKDRFSHREEFAGVMKVINAFLSGAPSKSRAKRMAAMQS